MLQGPGKFLIILGLILTGAGVLLYFSPPWSQIPLLKHLGRLPGDIAVQREGFRFYFPLSTSLLVSLLLSVIFYLVRCLRK
ncbi:MAG TPA: DUF2905 domain-containing protein [Deltaproteobacteria bacterium]|nr:DUF2905 domain-containing protein [Deltaproteobacteria bacterium]